MLFLIWGLLLSAEIVENLFKSKAKHKPFSFTKLYFFICAIKGVKGKSKATQRPNVLYRLYLELISYAMLLKIAYIKHT